MRLYTENEKKNYDFIINFWRRLVTTLLYIKVVCKHKTSLVRCSDYFRKQHYAFRNQLGALIKRSVRTEMSCINMRLNSV